MRSSEELEQEVAECKRAEEGLVQERVLCPQLMENIPDKIFFKDTTDGLPPSTKALTTYSGLGDPAEAIGQSLTSTPFRDRRRPAR